MKSRLFNNAAYPVMNSPEAISAALSCAETRGVVLKDHILKFGGDVFTAQHDENLAYTYSTSGINRPRKTAGRKQYAEVTAQDILSEAKEAGIKVSPYYSDTLAEAVNSMHGLFTEVYRSVWNDNETPVVSQLLFTPKGGIGRAPLVHIDNNRLTGHWAIALSGLDIMMSEPSSDLWNALNRTIHDATIGVDKALDIAVLEHTSQAQENFETTDIGDMLFLKGQRGRNLNDEFERQQMSVHKSADAMRKHGQVGAMFYPKFPKSKP